MSGEFSNLIERCVIGWDYLSGEDASYLEGQLHKQLIPTALIGLAHAKLAWQYLAEFEHELASVNLGKAHDSPCEEFSLQFQATIEALTAANHLLHGEIDSALAVASAIETELLSVEYKSRISILLARIFRRLGKQVLAERQIEKSRYLLTDEDFPALLGVCEFQLGIQFKSSVDLHLARKSFSRATNYFRQSNHPILEQRARFNQLILWRKLGHLQKARQDYDALKETGIPIGNVGMYMNEYLRLFVALEDEPMAATIFVASNGIKSINSVVRTRTIAKEAEADLHALKGDWDAAMTALNQGLDLAYEISEQNDLVGELLRRKARVFYELGYDDEAFATAKKALEVCELVGEIYEIGAIFRTLGLLAERRREYSEAENLILKAIEFYREKDEKFERAHSHREIAHFYRRIFRYRGGDEDLREAFRHCATALSLFDEMGIKPRCREMQELLDDLTKRLPSRPFVPPVGQELLAIGKEQGIVTGDTLMADLLETVATIAPSDSAVLITGETGTGKELFARAIHDLSDRRDESLVVVNCAAIPDELMESELFGHLRGSFTGAHRDRKGKFALAHNGTLFLDEIGDLSPRLQAKLLRVLQDGMFSPVGSDETIHANVRIISATNRDLEARVQAEKFRKDLLYRLNHITLDLPPLHRRGDDISLLAHYFLHEESERLGRKIEIDNHAMDKIQAYPWPGNVRELLNFMRRMALFARETGRLTTNLFPETYLTPMSGYQQDLATIVLGAEKEAIINALARSGGNKAAAARLLSISRSTINDKIRRYNLTSDFYEKVQRRENSPRS